MQWTPIKINLMSLNWASTGIKRRSPWKRIVLGELKIKSIQKLQLKNHTTKQQTRWVISDVNKKTRIFVVTILHQEFKIVFNIKHIIIFLLKS